jgi:diamine N-acetyltransferase
MPEPKIRRAAPEDAAAMARIARETFVETFGHLYPPADLSAFLDAAYAEGKIRDELADRQCAGWLVEADGQTVGYAQAGPCALPHPDVGPTCGELKRLYLLRGWQGGGLGGRLLDQALAWLERDGPRDLYVGVWSENHGAQRLYARLGFEKIGEYGFPVGATIDHEFILRRAARI